MRHLHPHEKEEIELQEYIAMGPAYHDAEEARHGARWNDDWQSEFILTDRDVWISNPCYRGPAGRADGRRAG